MKKEIIRKIIYTLILFLFFGAVMLLLTHTAQNGMQTTQILPGINPDPVYVECEPGETLEVMLTAKEDFQVSGFPVLLVNIAEDSRGTLRFTVTDDTSSILVSQVIPVKTITPGKWFTIAGAMSFTAGQSYKLSVFADGSAPYFMQVPEGEGAILPFTEQVIRDGATLECGISLGIDRVVPVRMTYGDIFYYSIPFSVLFTLTGLLCIWAGRRKVWTAVSRLRMPAGAFVDKYGNVCSRGR